MIRRSCVKGWLNGCRAESSPGKYAFNFNMASEKKGHVILSLPCCSRTLQEMQVQANNEML